MAEAELPRRGPGMLESCAEQVGHVFALKDQIRAMKTRG